MLGQYGTTHCLWLSLTEDKLCYCVLITSIISDNYLVSISK